jgi:hypothetical protein
VTPRKYRRDTLEKISKNRKLGSPIKTSLRLKFYFTLGKKSYSKLPATEITLYYPGRPPRR